MKMNADCAPVIEPSVLEGTPEQLVERVIASNIVAGDDATDRGDLVQAEYFYRNAIDLAELQYGGKGAPLAYLLTILADFYESQNRLSDVAEVQRRIRDVMADYVRAEAC
jgi:hypothetical protein